MKPPDDWTPECEHDDWSVTLFETWPQGGEESFPETEIRLECNIDKTVGPKIEEHHLTALLRGAYE